MQKYKKILLFGLWFLLFFFIQTPNVLANTNNITGLVFTTTEQVVKPGEISKSVTVQTQNSSGTSEEVSETNDVVFTSTSVTGEFLNSSGNAVSTTMSKNTSSRTFYYKDFALGTFDLTVSIKGRETSKVFSATQKITISNKTETTDTTTTKSNSSSDPTGGVSSHASQTSISTVPESFNLKVSAGRKRFALAGAEVEFGANTIIEGNTNSSVSYEWAFGDGNSGGGKEIRHIYRFPGEYNIVLNAKAGGNDAVSRTEIKIVEAEISIKEIKSGQGGFVEISNNSSYETNIGNFTLSYASSTSVISKDTIIMPRSSIKIPLSIPESATVVLKYPEGGVLAVLESSLANSPEKEKIISQLESKLAYLEDEAIKMKLAENDLPKEIAQTISNPVEVSSEIASEKTPSKNESASTGEEVPKGSMGQTEQSAALLNAFENHEENQTWISKSVKFFKGIFGY